MSEGNTTQLLERAAEVCDYFQDKLPAQIIEKDLERNDLEMLWVHVRDAEFEIARQEYYGSGDVA